MIWVHSRYTYEACLGCHGCGGRNAWSFNLCMPMQATDDSSCFNQSSLLQHPATPLFWRVLPSSPTSAPDQVLFGTACIQEYGIDHPKWVLTCSNVNHAWNHQAHFRKLLGSSCFHIMFAASSEFPRSYPLAKLRSQAAGRYFSKYKAASNLIQVWYLC